MTTWRRYQTHAIVALTAAATLALGCQLPEASDASVVGTVGAATSVKTANIRSVAMRYETVESYAKAGSTGEGPGTSGHNRGIVPASFGSDAAISSRRLLAIRYPHPNGRLDVARVELVVGDPTYQAKEQPETWHGRLATFFTELTPGVSWAPGIQQAKSMDLKLTELQQLTSESQNWTRPMQAGYDSEPTDANLGVAQEISAKLSVEINGAETAVDGIRAGPLEKLATRVLRQGKLMTVRIPASELFSEIDAKVSSAVALSPTISSPTPLPAVD